MFKKLFFSIFSIIILGVILQSPTLVNASENQLNSSFSESNDYEDFAEIIDLFKEMSKNLDSIIVLDSENKDITDEFTSKFVQLFNKADYLNLYKYYSENVGEVSYINSEFDISPASTSSTATYLKNTPRSEYFYFAHGARSYKIEWIETLRVKYTYNTSTGQITSITENALLTPIWHSAYSFHITKTFSHTSVPSIRVTVNNSYRVTPSVTDSSGWSEVLQPKTFYASGVLYRGVLH